MKQTLLMVLTALCLQTSAQYIAVTARYTGTRLVDDSPNPPKRENHLILTFHEVSPAGMYTPASLVNYELYIYKQGLQYGNELSGMTDSIGNNYPGYGYTAPRAVSYYNSLGPGIIDCDPNLCDHYLVNGSILDAGWVTVSHWDFDQGTGQPFENFSAPNICLPYYAFGHPYFFTPGNLNFDWSSGVPGPPYNLYNFACSSGGLNLVMRGVLPADSSGMPILLPVRFASLRGELRDSNATIEWSNLTESRIDHYTIERSTDGVNWQPAGTIPPVLNNGGPAYYSFQIRQETAMLYYRVRAVETNGQSFYSNLVVLRKPVVTAASGESVPQLLIYPNPVSTGRFQFRLTHAPAGRYLALLISPDGLRLRQKMIEQFLDNADLVKEMEGEGLAPGLYQLVLLGPGKRYTASLLISQ